MHQPLRTEILSKMHRHYLYVVIKKIKNTADYHQMMQIGLINQYYAHNTDV